jgi:hypothetical protein
MRRESIFSQASCNEIMCIYNLDVLLCDVPM